ncbi:molybdopterin-dependent oxidoreductase [Kribbella pratensis]|uniref:DMSO/TMAO reductase YedYZ molybdopterin-dependent catalytic subunit n=1 Tax=Kribbella pratensis TaxID=2512112 RepID=A0A4R8CMI0_9ACTN|nr:molybdopterin-dependent oxidoreductase [Kribbella pratensis]TDW77292.1 DMSO/TMAO reductase YedYZ molybdopterin-dependent catalytic subunit [Kribbella pratensis]
MGIVNRGFHGRGGADEPRLPPGQHLTDDFPVLSASVTPLIPKDKWEFTVTSETGVQRTWRWQDLLALPSESVVADIHCVTRWSKFGTRWEGVPVDAFLDDVITAATHVTATSYGGYTTNLPLAELRDGKAWIVYRYDGQDLAALHGGPARLLVPHLYFWKSAKWLNGLQLSLRDEPGFWERAGYHNHGDPWREQRYEFD